MVEGDNKLEALYKLIDGKPGGAIIYSTEKQPGGQEDNSEEQNG